MKHAIGRLAFLPCLLLAGSGASLHARELQGVEFAEHLDVADWQMPLRLSGVAVQQRSFLPFYVVALYVDRARVDPGSLQRGLSPARIVLHWLTPALDATAAHDYWMAEFDRRTPDPITRDRLAASLERVIRAFGTAERGDEITLDYHPDRGLRVSRNRVPAGQFAGLELNRLVLGLWLDPATPVDIRAGLLEGLAPPASPK
jgi:hypothetical protein